MADIKIAILEKDSVELGVVTEYDFETLLNDYGVRKRRFTLKLVSTISNSAGWLRLCDQGIATDQVGYIPPYECYVKTITFTNRNSGTIGNPYVAEIRALSIDADNDDDITTSSQVDWYVDGSSAQDQYANGRRWRHVAPNEDDICVKDRAYGFRFEEITNGDSLSDIYFEVEFEEILS